MLYTRIAQLEDAQLFDDMCRDMHAESRYAHIPYRNGLIASFIENNYMEDTFLPVMLYDDADHCGLMALSLSSYCFSREKIMEDIGIYVRPDKRSFVAVKTLVDGAESEAIRRGVHAVIISITAPEYADQLSQVYSKLGYRYWGPIYRKEMKHGQ